MESVFLGRCFKSSGAALTRMVVVSLAVVCIILGSPAGRALASPPGMGWHLAMEENFNGDSIDDTFFRNDYGIHWTPEAVSLDDGFMTLTTYSVNVGTQQDPVWEHHGGSVSSSNTFSYLYGYIEARVKFNNSQGNCQAFWLESDGMFWDPPCYANEGIEIDIIEQRHTDGENNLVPDMFHIELHARGYEEEHYSHGPSTQPTVTDLEDEWHTIGCEWDHEGYRFYCDDFDEPVWTYEPTTLQNILNGELVSEGNEWVIFDSDPWGSWCGTLLESYGSLENSTTKMTVDYCKLYQKNSLSWNLGNGGNGTWSPTGTNWNFTDGYAGMTFQTNAEVYFRGSPGTVTISGFTPYVTSLHFETDGYTLTGGSVYMARRDITVNQGLTATINSQIQGPKGIKLIGQGKLILGGNNTYTGETIIAQGSILNIRSANALGSTSQGTLVDGYGTLQIEGGITTANEPLTIEGPGVDCQGALRNVSGNNTYAGLITLGSDYARICSASGTLTLSNTGTITGAGNTLVLTGYGNTIINSVIGNGTGGVHVYGGTVTLNRANTYTGFTGIYSGTLVCGTNNALASGSIIVDGGTLNLGSYSDTVGSVTLYDGSITGTGTLTTSSTYNLWDGTVNAVLAGNNYAFYKNSGGTVTLTNANTYTSTTQVTAGALNIQHANALGSTGAGTIVASGATLQIQGGITTANEPLTLEGEGVTSYGALRNISGNNTYSGLITLGSDGVFIGSDSGTLTLGNTGTITGAGNDLILTGAGDIIIKSVIGTGSGGLTVCGSGSVELDNNSTYTGMTTVQSGSLEFTVNNAIGSGPVTINGGSLDLRSRSDTVGAVTLNGGAIYGPGVLTSTSGFTLTGGTADGVFAGSVGLAKTGAGTASLLGANSYTGTTTVSAGALNIQHANALGTTGSGTTVASGAALQIQGGITMAAEPLTINGSGVSNTGALRNISGNNTYAGNITLGSNATIASDSNNLYLNGSGTLTGSGRNLTIGGAGGVAVDRNINTGSGSVTKTGSGTAIFFHANSYTGTTYVQDGTLIAQSGTALGSTASGTVVSAGATLKVQSGITVAEPLTLSGVGFDDGGALRSSGSNTVSGLVTCNSYAVHITSDSGTLTLSNAGTISGTTNYLTFGGEGDITVNSIIGTGVGSVIKYDSGTLVLTGNNTYTGNTILQGGTLELASSGAQSRILTGGGCDIHQGKLVFDYPDQSNTILSLLDASYEDGDWDTGQFLCITADEDHGLGWIDDGSSKVTVAYTVYGDANLDGVVNDTDVDIVLENLNESGVWGDGDFNYDGLVNNTDLTIVNANFGMSQSFMLEIDEVPEPSTLILLAVAGIVGTAAYVRRRRALS